MRSTFLFEMGAGLEPGKYEFLLKSSGIEVTRLPFTLVGRPPHAGTESTTALGN
jgi:hypothetical protein